jgi:hypothetical protein
MRGQDPTAIVETLEQILERMARSAEESRRVLAFLELSKMSSRNASTVLFISDQLVEGLEAQGGCREQPRLIQQLLGVREAARL